jgi:hypothetical protein
MLSVRDLTGQEFVFRAERVAHSPAPLALICIRLI